MAASPRARSSLNNSDIPVWVDAQLNRMQKKKDSLLGKCKCTTKRGVFLAFICIYKDVYINQYIYKYYNYFFRTGQIQKATEKSRNC